MKAILTGFFLLAMAAAAGAQDFGYGIRAGLNFSRFDGELEQNGAGETVEEFDLISSFHVGFGFVYEFTSYLGLRAELMYSQKGVRHRFEGDSYAVYTSTTGNTLVSTGERVMVNNIINSYVDLPLMLFVKPAKWLEISIGPSVGVLASASGAGNTNFNGRTQGGANVPQHSITLEYNYFGDETGEADFSIPNNIRIGTQDVELPIKAGAYWDTPRGDEPFFNRLDLGLNAGLSVYLTKTLYLGGRLNYGLSDVTNNAYEFSLVKLDENNNRIPRSDFDRNISIQASLGFNLK
jgi:hypothetical protein